MKRYFVIFVVIVMCFGLIGIPTSAKSTETKLISSDSVVMDFFGYTVSVDKDTIVIGAWGDDDNGSGSGSVYVFVRDKNGWIDEAKLNASDGAKADHFGRSVSVYKNTIVVGAPYDDDNGSASGSVYVFVRDNNGWIEAAKLTGSDAAKADHFGFSVSVDKDTVIVGAYGNDDKGYASGSAYVFIRDRNGWIEEAKLTASDGAAGDYFGFSVSVDKDTIIVGAPYNDDNGYDSGSVYVFIRDKNGWIEAVKLIASDGTAFDYFGFSLSVDKDTIVVGAWGDDDKGSASGSAYVFVHDKNGWIEEAKLTASDGAAADNFGFSLSVNKDTIVVGAYGDDDNLSLSGSAYVFN